MRFINTNRDFEIYVHLREQNLGKTNHQLLYPNHATDRKKADAIIKHHFYSYMASRR